MVETLFIGSFMLSIFKWAIVIYIALFLLYLSVTFVLYILDELGRRVK